MAKVKDVAQVPVIVDTEDLQMRCFAAMHIAGLTLQDVADYMGVSVHKVQGALAGREYMMSVAFLCSFSAIVGCKVADLLPFANDYLPQPFDFSVVGGGVTSSRTPSPYSIAYSDPEDLEDRRWYGKEIS